MPIPWLYITEKCEAFSCRAYVEHRVLLKHAFWVEHAFLIRKVNKKVDWRPEIQENLRQFP